MWGLIGYIVATTVGSGLVIFLARRTPVFTDPPEAQVLDLHSTTGRHQGVVGGLMGLTVTGVVLLVTLAKDPTLFYPDQFDAMLLLFLVAFLIYVGTGVMFANLPRTEPALATTQRVQFGLSIAQYYMGIFMSLFGLKLLLVAFHFDRVANVFSWILFISVLLGWGTAASVLRPLGFATTRLAVSVMPAVALGSAFLFLGIVELSGDALKSGTTPSYMAVGAFGTAWLNLSMHTIVQMNHHSAAFRRFVEKYGRLLVLGASHNAICLVTFTWLAAMGLV